MESTDRDLGFRERLAKVIGQQDPYPWAESLGIGKSTFAGPWNKGAMPQTKTLLKIALNTDISLNWLLTGRGPERLTIDEHSTGTDGHGYTHAGMEAEKKPYIAYMASTTQNGQMGHGGCSREENELGNGPGAPVEERGETYRVPREEYCLVPRYGIRVDSGQLLHSEQWVDYLSFKVSWVEQMMGLDARELALVNVFGDSMEPTLKEGDLLLLDRRGFSHPGPGRAVRSDAIYVLLRGEELVVKRLQFGFDGSVTIQSDNPVYATQMLPADKLHTLQVMGRVVWIGRKV
ncbi:MAG: LexA family transcriptional regulator [Magnetococcales bacterium]|nr:LexA family transcriptional regulator [Magnetococcales bacterium]